MARSATNPRSISSINGSAHHDRNVLETARWSKDLEAAHLRTNSLMTGGMLGLCPPRFATKVWVEVRA